MNLRNPPEGWKAGLIAEMKAIEARGEEAVVVVKGDTVEVMTRQEAERAQELENGLVPKAIADLTRIARMDAERLALPRQIEEALADEGLHKRAYDWFKPLAPTVTEHPGACSKCQTPTTDRYCPRCRARVAPRSS